MLYHPLGRSGLSVSEICLGTMTWGVQNTQQDADEQLAVAMEAGINFIDTAEMYPVPPSKDTYGDTERVLGNWLARHAEQREKLIIMTKIAGSGLKYIRGGSEISADTIPLALDDSLQRLGIGCIDVYQLHWTNRASPHFAKHWPWRNNPTQVDVAKERDNMAGVVEALGQAIKQGKIRHWALSDDTPWGIHTYLQLCEQLNVPRPVSIQNEFSLAHLKDWPYVIESCVFEDIAYLPWSPLAAGLLTGKYLDGARPVGSRWSMAQRMGLFRDTKEAQDATRAYVELAAKYNISPAQLALNWVQQVPGVTSTIIGATSISQLKENIAAFSIPANADMIDDISKVIKRFPMPF